MRHITFVHDGREYRLKATFEAGEEIAEKVADPLYMVREASIEAQLASANIPYQPKFMMGMKETRKIMEIGLRAAGEDASIVKEAIMEMGLAEARGIASQYIGLFILGGEKKLPDAKGDAKPGE